MASPLLLQDPRLALLPEGTRDQINKQAMYRGMADMGMGLLAQSGYSAGPAPTIGEAFGRAAPAFSQGVDDVITQGLLVSEEQAKRDSEAARQKRIAEVIADPFITDAERKTLQFAIDTDNSSLAEDVLKKREKESLISKVNPDDFTPASVEAFAQSGNYSDLKFRPELGGKGDASHLAAAQRLFEKQAAELMGGRIMPDGSISGLDATQAKTARAMATTAGERYASSDYPGYSLANSVTKAANEYKNEETGEYDWAIPDIGDSRTVRFDELR